MGLHKSQEEIIERHNFILENKKRVEHRDVLLSIGLIMKSDEGKKLFSYMFKHLNAVGLPEDNLEGNLLHENIGLLKAGNSIYKLACQADFETAALLLSKLEREKYDDIREQDRIEQELIDARSSYEYE